MLDRSPTSTLPQWLYAEDTLRRYVTSEAIYDVTSERLTAVSISSLQQEIRNRKLRIPFANAFVPSCDGWLSTFALIGFS
jgi:hypothetical protein